MNELSTAPSAELNTMQSSALIMDAAAMDSMFRVAEIMAMGRSTIPEHLRGNKGDCMAIVMQAVAWQMNPYAVAQKTHVVNGTLGYEAQLVNAVIQSSKVTTGRFEYEWFGPWEKIIGKTKVMKKDAVGKYGDKDYKKAYEYQLPDYSMADEAGLGVRVWATLKGEQQPRTLELLLVQASVRNSPLWATDPKQQLAYLAVKRWTRLYAPDVILGVYTPDEFEQDVQREQKTQHMGAAEVVAPEIPAALSEAADKAAAAGVAAYSQFWTDVSKGGKTTKEHRVLLGSGHDARKKIAQRADADRTIEQPAPTAAPAQTDDEFLAGLDKAAP